MKSDPACPDCKVRMNRGFIPDLTYGGFQTTRWHPGEPREATFFGLPAGTKVDTSRMATVVAYRCGKCTLLRFYAPED